MTPIEEQATLRENIRLAICKHLPADSVDGHLNTEYDILNDVISAISPLLRSQADRRRGDIVTITPCYQVAEELRSRVRLQGGYVGMDVDEKAADAIDSLTTRIAELSEDSECLKWVAENATNLCMFSSIFGFHADLNKDRDPQEFEWWPTRIKALRELYRQHRGADDAQ